MLVNGPVSYLIQVVKLSFKHHKVFTSLTVEIDGAFLVFLKSINDFKEVSGLQKEFVITWRYSGIDLFKREKQGVLIEIGFEMILSKLCNST